MEALTPTLESEVAPALINLITPGLMDTPRLHLADGAERDAIVQNQAARVAWQMRDMAEEVAQVILMLMTNDYMIGEAVRVEGGGRFV